MGCLRGAHPTAIAESAIGGRRRIFSTAVTIPNGIQRSDSGAQSKSFSNNKLGRPDECPGEGRPGEEAHSLRWPLAGLSMMVRGLPLPSLFFWSSSRRRVATHAELRVALSAHCSPAIMRENHNPRRGVGHDWRVEPHRAIEAPYFLLFFVLSPVSTLTLQHLICHRTRAVFATADVCDRLRSQPPRPVTMRQLHSCGLEPATTRSRSAPSSERRCGALSGGRRPLWSDSGK